MSSFTSDPAVLVLEDGTRHTGRAYGARGTTLGEVVFSTGMTGYQETLTDPSYAGQIVLQTAPHIGNTGMNDEDPESRRIWVAGYIVRDPSRVVSNWRAEESLDDALEPTASSGSAASTPGPSPGTSARPAACAAGSSPGMPPTWMPTSSCAWSARRRRWPGRTCPPRSRSPRRR